MVCLSLYLIELHDFRLIRINRRLAADIPLLQNVKKKPSLFSAELHFGREATIMRVCHELGHPYVSLHQFLLFHLFVFFPIVAVTLACCHVIFLQIDVYGVQMRLVGTRFDV